MNKVLGGLFCAIAMAIPAYPQQVRLVSRAASGSSATGIGGHSWLGQTGSYQLSPTGRTLSADGRFVAFTSAAKNLVPGQVEVSSLPNVFRYDRIANTMSMISHKAGSTSVPGNQGGGHAFISADGCLVAFESASTDLLPGPAAPVGPSPQVFLYDCNSDATLLVSHAAASPTTPGDSNSALVDLSADGTEVLFASLATDLIAGGMLLGGGSHLFVRDAASGMTKLVSHTYNSSVTSANASAFQGRISADGRVVVFASLATDLVGGFVPAAPARFNVFSQDRLTGTTILVSRQSGTTTSSGARDSTDATLSADGRWIAFNSEANNLVPGQVDSDPGSSDVFLFDGQTSTTALVSHVAGQPLVAADQSSYYPAIDDDGRYVAFASAALTLVAGFVDGNDASTLDLYLYDRITGSLALVSHVATSLTTSGNLGANAPIVGSDGRVAFQSFSTDLLAVPGAFSNQAFVFDGKSGSIRLASHAGGSATRGGNGSLDGEMAMSADGRYVAFSSSAPDLVARDNNAFAMDVFLFGPVAPLAFYTLPPCRAADTRSSEAPPLSAGATRDLPLAGRCGVPSTAEAVAVNLTVVSPTAPGYLTVFAAGQLPPSRAIPTSRPDRFGPTTPWCGREWTANSAPLRESLPGRSTW